MIRRQSISCMVEWGLYLEVSVLRDVFWACIHLLDPILCLCVCTWRNLYNYLMLYNHIVILYILYSIVEGNGTPLQYSCLENPMDGGAWKAAVHGVAEGRTWPSDFIFTFHFHALEKEMATHSSVLAWRIPGIGKPGGLPSMGSHRVGHDWSDLAIAIVYYTIHNTIYNYIWHYITAALRLSYDNCSLLIAVWYGGRKGL